MNIKLSSIKNFLIFFMALLPLQLTLRLICHLPNFLMLIYIFLIFAIIYYFLLPIKKISKIQLITSIILLIFFFTIVISVLFNYSDIIDKVVPFQYYVSKYSPFWDSAIMSSLFAGVIRPFIYFLFCFCSFFILQKEKHLYTLSKYLIIIGFISSVYSIYQFIAFYTGLPFDSLFSGHNGEIITQFGIRRCEGILYEPGPQATYLSVIFSLLLFQFHKKSRNGYFFKSKIFELLVLSLVSITLFLTLSPIGILTPFIAGSIYIFLNWKKLSIKFKRNIFYVSICILLFLAFFSKLGEDQISLLSYLGNKICNLQSNNSIYFGDHRSVRNEFAINIIKKHFLFGVGAGNDAFYYAKYAPYAIGKLPDKGVVINNNLKILSDSGIFAFLSYIILLLYPLIYFCKNKLYFNIYNLSLYNLTLSLFTSELLFVVLTFNSQVEFFQPLFWIIYSMLIASINVLNKEKKLIKLKEIK